MATAPAAALGGTSHVRFWQPSGRDFACGLSIHIPGEAQRILCSARGVPAPKKGVGFGDPGFVFLAAHGRPELARLSQDTFAGTTIATLAPGTHWLAAGVTCAVHASTVRCANRSGHGFTIGKRSYVAF